MSRLRHRSTSKLSQEGRTGGVDVGGVTEGCNGKMKVRCSPKKVFRSVF